MEIVLRSLHAIFILRHRISLVFIITISFRLIQLRTLLQLNAIIHVLFHWSEENRQTKKCVYNFFWLLITFEPPGRTEGEYNNSKRATTNCNAYWVEEREKERKKTNINGKKNRKQINTFHHLVGMLANGMRWIREWENECARTLIFHMLRTHSTFIDF